MLENIENFKKSETTKFYRKRNSKSLEINNSDIYADNIICNADP